MTGGQNDGEEIHRVLVDRGLNGDSKAKLSVAGYPTLMLGYELTRKLQRRMGDLDRGALDHRQHVGNVHVEDNMARVERFGDAPEREWASEAAGD